MTQQIFRNNTIHHINGFSPRPGKNARLGFTLVELLVVMAIVGILLIVTVPVFLSSQSAVRDTRRKSDLHKIELALTQYYADHNSYPTSQPVDKEPDVNTDMMENWNYDTQTEYLPNWIAGLVPNYLKSLPHDPVDAENFNTPDFYDYSYKSDTITNSSSCVAGQWYALYVNLENSSDPDTIANEYAAGKPVTWCDGTVVTGDGSQGSPKMFPNTYLVVVKG